MFKAVFITQGNETVGTGHLKRCLILAGELKSHNFNIEFMLPDSEVSNIDLKGFETRLINFENCLAWLKGLANGEKATEVVIIIDCDRPELHEHDLQLRIKSSGAKLMYFSFSDEHYYCADIILNQNPLSKKLEYHTSEKTKKLLGLDYAIINSSFLTNPPPKDTGNSIFVSFGGSDEPDRTLFLLKAVSKLAIDKIHMIVVTGALYKHREKLEHYLKNEFPHSWELHVNTNKMPELMSRSKAAFTSGGTTAWELDLFGVPNGIISYSPREVRSSRYLHEIDFATHIGSFHNNSLSNLESGIKQFIKAALNGEKSHKPPMVNIHGKELVASEIVKLFKP